MRPPAAARLDSQKAKLLFRLTERFHRTDRSWSRATGEAGAGGRRRWKLPAATTRAAEAGRDSRMVASGRLSH